MARQTLQNFFITPVMLIGGVVGLATAGNEIVHDGRTPDYLRRTCKKLHGLQIWIGSPKHLEQFELTFHHIPFSRLTVWIFENFKLSLIVGEVMEKNLPWQCTTQRIFLN